MVVHGQAVVCVEDCRCACRSGNRAEKVTERDLRPMTVQEREAPASAVVLPGAASASAPADSNCLIPFLLA